jgi:CMP-N-acetylneuraminic acid synthetase
MYSIFGSTIKPLLNSEAIIDIDTAKDLKLAEAMMSI